MTNDEMDVFEHLQEVERDASAVVLNAQKEADKRLAAARARADSDFQKLYSAVSAKIEKDEAAEKAAIDKDRQKILKNYLESLKAHKKDYKSFNMLMDRLLFPST